MGGYGAAGEVHHEGELARISSASLETLETLRELMEDSDYRLDELDLDLYGLDELDLEDDNSLKHIYFKLLYYHPEHGLSGPDVFSYTITDSAGTVSTSSVTINVVAIKAHEVDPAEGHQQDLHTEHGKVKFHLPPDSDPNISHIHIGVAHGNHEPPHDEEEKKKK